MMNRLHHVAIATKKYDWYVEVFSNLFEMEKEKSVNIEGKRKIWFKQGIQINEVVDSSQLNGKLDHIALMVSNIEKLVGDAKSYGIQKMEQSGYWLQFPDGLSIECFERKEG
ncbi:VOC family protein [Streptococcus sp. S784/96/1]|uniref:VOC family protein n=1 Tax=Streptococcus sp. S784/96/1 TaxID=2653499 RepID=UPI001386634B|nr:hypothetical protein [Streptococcus sp. S784/96/1]